MKFWLPPLITVAVTLGTLAYVQRGADCPYNSIWKPVGAFMVYGCPIESHIP